MEEYYFLFSIGLVYVLFAAIQDIRTKEVANWLNFSLIAFGFSYRIFYGLVEKNLQFIYMGVLGFLIFFGLAYAFYYGKIFAGGDAKLLMGFGVLIPGRDISNLVFNLSLFIFMLFLIGAVYSLVYSIFLVFRDRRKFVKEFKIQLKGKEKLFLILFLVGLGLNIAFGILGFFGLLFIWAIPLMYYYLKSLEKSCMIVYKNAFDLTEGDWLERDVRVNNKWVRKSVHGLSESEIKMLRNANKSVWIKEGIPFVPAFLICWVFMVSFFLFLKGEFSLLFYLF